MGRGRFNGGISNSFDFSCEQQNQLRLRAKWTGDDHSSVKLSAGPQPTSSKMSLLLWTAPLSLRCCNPSRNRFNESLTPQQLFSFVCPGDVQCMAKNRKVPSSFNSLLREPQIQTLDTHSFTHLMHTTIDLFAVPHIFPFSSSSSSFTSSHFNFANWFV